MSKIPTAEEFLKKHQWTKDYPEILREYAIIIKNAALEAASKVGWVHILDKNTEKSDIYIINSSSILNAYPDNLIQ